MQENLTNYLLAKSEISDSLTYATREITEIAQCYFKKQSPTYKARLLIFLYIGPQHR